MIPQIRLAKEVIEKIAGMDYTIDIYYKRDLLAVISPEVKPSLLGIIGPIKIESLKTLTKFLRD